MPSFKPKTMLSLTKFIKKRKKDFSKHKNGCIMKLSNKQSRAYSSNAKLV